MTEQECDEQLQRALAYSGGTHTVADIRAGVAAGRFQIWQGTSSVVVTELVDYPRQRDVVFFLAAGDMDEVREAHDVILKWAKEQGCTRATCIGRPGWQRTFVTKEAGWSTSMVLYTKELWDG